ncbi:MAG: hypothetical protein HQM14_07025 [SAR324 cluster bacterium]|nr:hypothetical protein [SAR324 cluster bacterium]
MTSRLHGWKIIGIGCLIFGLTGSLYPLHALQFGRPLKTDILDNADKPIAKALIYIDYFEILDMNSKLLGKVGIVNANGIFQLFLAKGDSPRTLAGWAANRELYDRRDQLVGYYDWSSYWVYAYSVSGKRLGKAKCIAFRGYCAAGIAAYLTGLFDSTQKIN